MAPIPIVADGAIPPKSGINVIVVGAGTVPRIQDFQNSLREEQETDRIIIQDSEASQQQ